MNIRYTLKKFFLILYLLLFSSCLLAEGERRSVPMVNLITNPDKYSEDTVLFSGYFKEHGSMPYIFLSKERALMGDTYSGFRVYSDSAGYNKKKLQGCFDNYVHLVGKFRKEADYNYYEIHDVNKITILNYGEKFLFGSKCWDNKG